MKNPLVQLDTPAGAPKRYVPVAIFCKEYGYSLEAVRKKISRRVWRQNQEWCKAPDGRIYIDMEGFRKWVAGGVSRP